MPKSDNSIDSLIAEIFDESYYLQVYPDVKGANIDALKHFIKFGRYENRNPNAIFDAVWYASQIDNLQDLDPISHYLSIGNGLALDPNPFFDVDWYRTQYLSGDEAAIPLVHYFLHGHKLGYDPNPFFDVDWYALEYGSAEDYYRDPLSDFILSEAAELRNPNAMFSTQNYRDSNPDLLHLGNDALEIVTHYIRYGFLEDRSPKENLSFTRTYLTSNNFAGIRLSDSKKGVALLIPAFNNWYATERCLRSIFKTEDADSFDVYLLNDSSTDLTLKEIHRYPRVKVINTPQNLGFTRACNHAFKLLADYQFVYLLNNDTEVIDGFVNRSLEIMNERPAAGMVGSTLFNVDFTVQECGGLIWSDGSGWNFGRGEKSGNLEFSFSRQVDYCSGAGLLIRYEHLKLVDFFDESFAPAYYEDTDLAFKMRAHGFEVWVSCASKVIHHEGLTHGTDEYSGIKAHQAINRDLFLSKWSEALIDHFPPTSNREVVLKAAMNRVEFGEKILIWVDDWYPDRLRDSGSVRATELLAIAEEFFSALIISPIYEDGIPSEMERHKNLGKIIDRDIDSILLFLGSLGQTIDTAWLSRVTSAYPSILSIKVHSPKAKIIFDTVDLHHLRFRRELEIDDSSTGSHEYFTLKNTEELMMQLADITLVVSEFEMELYRNSDLFPKIKVLSNVHQVAQVVPSFEQTKGLVFIGGFLHTPNISGIKWFVDRVWPLVSQEIKKDGLTICGSNTPKEIYDLSGNGVNVIGWVKDSEKEIRKHRVSIAPLLVGAGVKGKIGEAMSLGIPVVATPIAIEGMGIKDVDQALVAQSPEKFAECINTLYTSKSLWEDTRNSAQVLISEKYSRESARRILESIFT